MRSYCGQARAVLFSSLTNHRVLFTGSDGALPIQVIYQPSSFVCSSFMSYPQVPSSVFKAVCVSDHRILKSSKSTNQMIDISVVKNIMSDTEKQRSSKQKMPQCIAKVRKTHEHHPFMYSHHMCPQLWTPSLAIYVYPAPGTEVVIFCQRARPRYD